MYEEKFRKGLQRMIDEKCLKQSAIAFKAGIRNDTFSKIMNGRRRIYGEEMASICMVVGCSVDDLIGCMPSIDDTEPKVG